MGFIAALILIIEIGAFVFLIWWQKKVFGDSDRALREIDHILSLKKFDIKDVTASDIVIDQFDRMVELPLEKIRSFSNAALVAGIGGTMGIFLLEAISTGLWVGYSRDISSVWFGAIILGLLLALLSSLIGVFNHLHITSSILSTAHDQISKKEAELLDAQAQEKVPESELSKQLEELTEAWNEADALDLFEMIPEFLQGQTAVMNDMQRRFGEQQAIVWDALENQKDVTQKIDEVLIELKNYSREQQGSVAKIQADQQNLLERVDDSLRRLINERKSLTTEIERLPGKIQKSINAEKIGEIFGRQAINYVKGLEDAFQETVFRFGESLKSNQKHLINRIVNENQAVIKPLSEFTGEVKNSLDHLFNKLVSENQRIMEGFSEFTDSLENSQAIQINKLISENQTVINSLSEFIRSLESSQDRRFGSLVSENQRIIDSLSEFTDSLENSQAIQINKFISENQKIVDSFGELRDKMEEHIVNPLGGIAVRLEETAATMPGAAQQFGDKLREAVQVLSGIPKELEEVGTNINEVVGSTTAEALAPLSDKMNRYIETVQHTHESLEKIIQGLVHLIRDMVKEMEREK